MSKNQVKLHLAPHGGFPFPQTPGLTRASESSWSLVSLRTSPPSLRCQLRTFSCLEWPDVQPDLPSCWCPDLPSSSSAPGSCKQPRWPCLGLISDPALPYHGSFSLAGLLPLVHHGCAAGEPVAPLLPRLPGVPLHPGWTPRHNIPPAARRNACASDRTHGGTPGEPWPRRKQHGMGGTSTSPCAGCRRFIRCRHGQHPGCGRGTRGNHALASPGPAAARSGLRAPRPALRTTSAPCRDSHCSCPGLDLPAWRRISGSQAPDGRSYP